MNKKELPYPARLRDTLAKALIMIEDDEFMDETGARVVYISEVKRVFEDMIATEVKKFQQDNK